MRRNEGGGSGSSGVRVRAVFAPGGACYIGIVFFLRCRVWLSFPDSVLILRQKTQPLKLLCSQPSCVSNTIR